MVKYEHSLISFKEMKNARLPKFQRGLVWTKQKKLDLIETLHKGFPFGSLLVAPLSENANEVRLLDGQQRLSAVIDYEKNKIQYWKGLNNNDYQQALNHLNSKIVQSEYDEIDTVKLDEILAENFELGDWTDDYADNIMNTDVKRALRDEVKDIRNKISDYIDLDTLQIPVIKFTGDQKFLPEVYENLNKGGTPLNKYDILSAAWTDDLISLPRDSESADKILQNVKNYYTSMSDTSEFELEDFSEDEITESRQVNLAEFSRALGKFVVDLLPSLFSSGDNKAINEMGFGILGISTDTDNKDIANINLKTDTIQRNINDILKNAERYSKKLNATFSKILIQNVGFGNKKTSKKEVFSTGLSTSFKTLSYFADFWEKDDNYISKSLKNIPIYYIFDHFNSSWTAHGDQRLKEYYKSVSLKNYQKTILKEEFLNAYKQWKNENLGVKKTFSKEIKALITIHSNLTYLSGTVPSGEDFEFEHVIPKARVLKNDDELRTVFLSSLGNGMFLPKGINNEKKEKTLYERDVKEEYSSLIEKSAYFREDEFEEIFSRLNEKDFEYVNDKIDNRAQNVVSTIYDKISE